MRWSMLIKKVILLIICVAGIYIFWSVKNKNTKDYNWTFSQAVQYDIDNNKGSEGERQFEMKLASVIGGVQFRLFIAFVFGAMIAGILELIWPSDGLAAGIQGIISLGFSINGVVGVVIAVTVAVFWAFLYAVICLPMIVIELIICLINSLVG